MSAEDTILGWGPIPRCKKDREHRELYASYLDHCNAHNFEAMQSFYTSPIVKINDENWSPEKVTSQFEPLVTAFPDWHWEMRNISVDGDYLALHFRVSGTHQGELDGHEPTGRTVSTSQFTLYHVVDDKFAEVWDLVDMQSLIKQIT
jgi:predicted ester cyclase